MGKLRIILDFKNGIALPDLRAKEFVDRILDTFTIESEHDTEIPVGTQVMFNEFRLALITDHKDLRQATEFYSHDVLISLSEYGQMSDWSNIDDRYADVLDRLLDISICHGDSQWPQE